MLAQRQESLAVILMAQSRHGDKTKLAPTPIQAMTDVQGRFEIDCVEVGDVPMAVSAKDWAPWSGSVHVDGSVPTRVDVHMQPGATLSGHVRRADGTPASRVYVEALGPSL